MNTTNLFVELIVIGVGAAIWISLLMMGCLDVASADLLGTLTTERVIPLLALIYVLGIVTDRIADVLFDRLWGSSAREERFGDLKAYYRARSDILTKSERLSDLLEYGRSRLRICRGWSLSSMLIAAAFNIWLSLSSEPLPHRGSVRIFGTVAFVTLALSTGYAWKKLVETEHRKVREQAEYLNQQAEAKAKAGAKA